MKKPAWTITRSLLRQLMQAARNVYPLEFIALLSTTPTNRSQISEFVVVPAEFGLAHSQLRTDLIPTDPLIVGTVHSHPTPSAVASDADLDAFARLGDVHLILRRPFDDSSFRAYLANGKSFTLPVV